MTIIDPYGRCPGCGHWEHYSRVCARQTAPVLPEICTCGAPSPWWRRALAAWTAGCRKGRRRALKAQGIDDLQD